MNYRSFVNDHIKGYSRIHRQLIQMEAWGHDHDPGKSQVAIYFHITGRDSLEKGLDPWSQLPVGHSVNTLKDLKNSFFCIQNIFSIL